jgi:hypothetical protein
VDSPVVGKHNAVATRSWQIFRDYEAQRSTWVKEAAENEDFFMGRQWTTREIQQLQERGMAPLVVNRTHPVIMQEVAILCAKKPSFRFFGREDGDTAMASMWSDAAAWVWDQSSGDIQYKQAVQDMFVTGAGYLQAYIDAYADDGNGEVRFRSVPVWDVYPDPNSRELDLSDARAIIVSRVIDKDQLNHLYPDKKAKIKKADEENGTSADRPAVNPMTDLSGGTNSSDYDYRGTNMQDSKARVIELYEKVKVPFYKIIDPMGGEDMVIPAEQLREDMIAPQSDYYTIWRDRIRLTITVGESTVLFKGMMPTSQYPIVPLYLHHHRNPYPSGDVALIKGMQREINKRRSIMIHNATLAGNYRLLAEKGQIVNKEEFKRSGSQPGFVLEWQQTGSGQAPREMLPQQLPNAWIQLEGEAKQDLEYTLSVFAHMMGSSQEAPETYRGLLALEEAGQNKIKHKSSHARQALRQLGRVIFDFMRYVYTEPKLMRISGEDNEDYRELWLNHFQPDEQTGQIKMVNDTQVGEYDLVVVDGSSMPTNRMALLELYMQLMQLGVVDREEVLKKTDVVNKNAVIQRMSEISQLSAQLQQAEETIKNLEGLNQTMRRQLQQSEVNQEIIKGQVAVDRSTSETAIQQRLIQQRMSDELGLMKKKAELAVKETKMDAAAFAVKSKMQSIYEQQQAKLKSLGKTEDSDGGDSE